MSDDRIISADEARGLLDGTTPGPWHADSEFGWLFALDDGARRTIARLDSEDTRETDDSDIAIIAAAPDLAVSVIALHERLATLDAEVARGIAERETLRRERDEALSLAEAATQRADGAARAWRNACEIIEGRTTPPTDDEIAAHAAAGGVWVHSDETTGTYADNDPGETAACRAEGDGLNRRWLPLDAEGRPCAWPKVTS